MTSLPNAIKRLRAISGLNAAQFSFKCGLERSYISKLENGEIKSPTLDTIIKIAVGFGLTVDELINGEFEPCPNCKGRGFVVKENRGE